MFAIGSPVKMFSAAAGLAVTATTMRPNATISRSIHFPKLTPPNLRILGHKAFYVIHDLEEHEVVPGRKQHQPEYEGNADAQAPFLRPLSKRPATHRLDRVEGQVPPVEQGDRKQIEQTEVQGERGYQKQKIYIAVLCNVARDFPDPQHASEFSAGACPIDHLPQRHEHLTRGLHGLRYGKAAGIDEAPPLVLGGRPNS